MNKIKINKIIINEKSYRLHHIYNMYGASEDGYIIHIIKRNPMKGNIKNSGYLHMSVRKHGESNQKMYLSHRFIWECYNGSITDDLVIDHINNDKQDNRLCNLQLLTQQQNNIKSVKNRDYSFVGKNYDNRKYVKAINVNTGEESFFNSMYSIQQHLGINAGIVKMVCEGLNNCKTGISKIDKSIYRFVYITKEELPNDYKKSANIRPKKKNKASQK